MLTENDYLILELYLSARDQPQNLLLRKEAVTFAVTCGMQQYKPGVSFPLLMSEVEESLTVIRAVVGVNSCVEPEYEPALNYQGKLFEVYFKIIRQRRGLLSDDDIIATRIHQQTNGKFDVEAVKQFLTQWQLPRQPAVINDDPDIIGTGVGDDWAAAKDCQVLGNVTQGKPWSEEETMQINGAISQRNAGGYYFFVDGNNVISLSDCEIIISDIKSYQNKQFNRTAAELYAELLRLNNMPRLTGDRWQVTPASDSDSTSNLLAEFSALPPQKVQSTGKKRQAERNAPSGKRLGAAHNHFKVKNPSDSSALGDGFVFTKQF